jgi:hypothetical protein
MPTAAGCEPWPRSRLRHLAWSGLLRKFWLAIEQAGKSLTLGNGVITAPSPHTHLAALGWGNAALVRAVGARVSAFLDQVLKNSEGACSGGNQVGRRYMRIGQKANSGDQQDEPTRQPSQLVACRLRLGQEGCWPRERYRSSCPTCRRRSAALRPLSTTWPRSWHHSKATMWHEGTFRSLLALRRCGGGDERVAAPGSPRTRRPRQLGHRADG